MKNNNTSQHYIGYRGFSSNSLFSVSTIIEYNNFSIDVVFIKIIGGGKDNNGKFSYNESFGSIDMQTNAINLRALAYAMKEIVRTKAETFDYELITKSDTLKKITLGFQNNNNREVFYVNANSNPHVSVVFSKWEMLSFADSLLLLSKELEEFLYKHQRLVKKSQSEYK